MNGSLTATVAVCAGCSLYPGWAALVVGLLYTVHCTLYCTVQVGLLAGPVFLAADKLLLRLGIDDPVSAIPVNGGGGWEIESPDY